MHSYIYTYSLKVESKYFRDSNSYRKEKERNSDFGFRSNKAPSMKENDTNIGDGNDGSRRGRSRLEFHILIRVLLWIGFAVIFCNGVPLLIAEYFELNGPKVPLGPTLQAPYAPEPPIFYQSISSSQGN
jgi:hypothetical protein